MIDNKKLMRLLDHIVEPADGAEPRFRKGVSDGFRFTPDLDLQDIATLAAIYSGEAWEDMR